MSSGDQHSGEAENAIEPAAGQGHGHGQTLLGALRSNFLAGLLVTAPLGITVYVTYIFVRFVDNNVAVLIPERYNPSHLLPVSVPGLGLVIAAVFLISVGWFAKNFFGRLIISLYEAIVDRMPVVRNVYGAIKQVFETVMASQAKSLGEVVLLEYPRKGIFSLGFVTGRSQGEIQRVTEDETINVFVPTTPNPTSGFLLFVPKKELFYLDMTAEEGIKMVISGGIITPPDKGNPEQTGVIKSAEEGIAQIEAPQGRKSKSKK